MNRVIHVDIPSDDPEKTMEFFNKVFGWTFNAWEEKANYWLTQSGEGESRGIEGAVTKKDENHQTIVNTINVYNIHETIDAIWEAGGEVISPVTQIPNIGKVAYFKSPEGNVFGIIQESY